MNTKENLGQILYQLRRKQRLTQNDVAQELKISPSSVSKWEHNIAIPDQVILQELAALYHVSPDIFEDALILETHLSDSENASVDNPVPTLSVFQRFRKIAVFFVLVLLTFSTTNAAYRLYQKSKEPQYEIVNQREFLQQNGELRLEYAVLYTGPSVSVTKDFSEEIFRDWFWNAYDDKYDYLYLAFFTDPEAAANFGLADITIITRTGDFVYATQK